MSFLFCEEPVQFSDLAKLMCSSNFFQVPVFLASFWILYKSLKFSLQVTQRTTRSRANLRRLVIGEAACGTLPRGTTRRFGGHHDTMIWYHSIPVDTIGHLGTAASLKKGASSVLQRSFWWPVWLFIMQLFSTWLKLEGHNGDRTVKVSRFKAQFCRAHMYRSWTR